jgi:hypothetical protein
MVPTPQFGRSVPMMESAIVDLYQSGGVEIECCPLTGSLIDIKDRLVSFGIVGRINRR